MSIAFKKIVNKLKTYLFIITRMPPISINTNPAISILTKVIIPAIAITIMDVYPIFLSLLENSVPKSAIRANIINWTAPAEGNVPNIFK